MHLHTFTSVKCSKKPIASQTSPCDMFIQGSGIKSSTAQAMKGQMKFVVEITKSFAKPTLKSRYIPPPGGPIVLQAFWQVGSLVSSVVHKQKPYSVYKQLPMIREFIKRNTEQKQPLFNWAFLQFRSCFERFS